jgi:hypothetical protein
VPKCKRVENNPLPALIYGKYKTAITKGKTARYLSFPLGIKKGATIMKTNLDIAARTIETIDFKFLLIEKRYKASMTKNICSESQCPLAAKLIRTNGLHAYIKTLIGPFPVTLKNLTIRNNVSTSKNKKAIFIDMMEWET